MPDVRFGVVVQDGWGEFPVALPSYPELGTEKAFASNAFIAREALCDPFEEAPLWIAGLVESNRGAISLTIENLACA